MAIEIDRYTKPDVSADADNENSKIGQIADDRFPDVKPGNLADLLPPKIETDYVQVGNKFHYGHKPELEAFQDNGNSIETKSTGQTVTKDIVEIAAARGWSAISVKGSPDFKRQVWLEASLKNLAVKGYQPTDADRATLIKAKEKQPVADAAVEKNEVKEKAKDADQNAPESGKASAKEKADALRTGDPSATLKRFPDLINAYALLKAAELLADKKIQNAEGKTAFVSSVKDTLANQVERGQAIPEVQYRDRTKQVESEMTQSR